MWALPSFLAQTAQLSANKQLAKEDNAKCQDNLTASFRGILKLTTQFGNFLPALSLDVSRPFFGVPADAKISIFVVGAGLGWKVIEQASLNLDLSKALGEHKPYMATLGSEATF